MALSGTVWPVHLKPQPDELLSSWMVRQANALQLKPHTFSSIVWPGIQIWNRDIDKFADEEFVRKLAEQTGVPAEMASMTLLREYEGRLYEKHNAYGNTPWIMPLGIYHRVHRDYGLQYCAHCFSEDKAPYFRRYWRLAFMVSCPYHNVLLLDRCCGCGNPINFHRNTSPEIGIYICNSCGKDLQDCGGSQAEVPVNLAKIQYILYMQFRDRWLYFPGIGQMYSVGFFTVFHQIWKFLIYFNGNQNLSGYIPELLYKNRIKNNEYELIERLENSERIFYMEFLWWLLNNWPGRFINVCKVAKITKSRITKDMYNIPHWYLEVADYLDKSIYSPSNSEINAAISYLQKHGQRINKTNVSRTLGIRDIFRKRSKTMDFDLLES